MQPYTGLSAPTPDLRLQLGILWVLTGALTAVVILLAVIYFGGFGSSAAASDTPIAAASPDPTVAPVAGATTTSSVADTTTTSGATTTTTLSPGSPPHASRYVVPGDEAEPQAKQLAADIAYALTTYEEIDDRTERLYSITGARGLYALTVATDPLTYAGSWSRGEVVYPQLGGLAGDKASVMVVTRQTVGRGADTEFSLVRTIDVRLIKTDDGWEFDSLASAGGAFDDLESLRLAGSVADDPRIVMPDSARLDIRNGVISPILLDVMSRLADVTPYEVTVLATGHPINVFDTERTSHHTLGRAVDIYAIGTRYVLDDRDPASNTHDIVEWLLAQSDVIQVGSPWDVDGSDTNRSFSDAVHQDHIHLAVIEE